ncbi:unnamed protein product [Phytophthora fragariaefolia]|uniref:Unnamed protein product n=1 Tax=Phytophthora fragariaefolia TaxID=1490495 RepID=A0A9W7CSN2_9STRA|nr:unnamed protein product [Phytophthora fragariaefolia]
MELSEYEAKRQRRVQQNRRQLEALGLPKTPRRARTADRKKREPQHVQPTRRSLRQRQLRGNAARAETEPEAHQALAPRPKRAKSEPPTPLNLPVTLPEELPGTGEGKNRHVSSSQIEIRLEDFHESWLGTQVLPRGKQTVMQGLCPAGYVAKFSKMSGVQPWENAVVLFVNVESHSPYDNVFRQEGAAVHFQWFAQKRWHDESPLVVRLRKIKRGHEGLRFDESFYDKPQDETHEEPLLLFLRHTQVRR